MLITRIQGLRSLELSISFERLKQLFLLDPGGFGFFHCTCGDILYRPGQEEVRFGARLFWIE